VFIRRLALSSSARFKQLQRTVVTVHQSRLHIIETIPQIWLRVCNSLDFSASSSSCRSFFSIVIRSGKCSVPLRHCNGHACSIFLCDFVVQRRSFFSCVLPERLTRRAVATLLQSRPIDLSATLSSCCSFFSNFIRSG
jgi:hypothetical protein